MNRNIFVNLLTYNSGGAKKNKKNYIDSLYKLKSKNNFFILTNEGRNSKVPNIIFLKIPNIYEKTFILPFTYLIKIPFMLKKYNIDIILNFCDLPILTNLYQIFYFDWPYAVYPESVVWKKMGFYDKFYRNCKLFLFKNLIGNCNLIIAQSKVISKRIKKIYDFNNVKVIKMGFEKKFKKNKIDLSKLKNPEKILLYPTKYYPHKNVEILIEVAKKIKLKKLRIKIFCTIDKTQHKNVKKIIKEISDYNLDKILIITGELNRTEFDRLFEKSVAILMPTILETYGIPYIEALSANKVIFTSDLDFARITCGEAAFYFDPFNSNSIISIIEFALSDITLLNKKLNEGQNILNNQKSWSEIMGEINLLITK